MSAELRILAGDCVEQMRELADESIDAVITDPPYGINFMGKAWDGAAIAEAAVSGVDHLTTTERSVSMHAGRYDLTVTANRRFQGWCEAWATEAFRVLKPGGHLLAFGGTRTYHRLTAGIEDAGFEIRDCLAWLFGSGFPKSLDVSKAIDKAAGAEREVVGQVAKLESYGPNEVYGSGPDHGGVMDITAPATPEVAAWEGWGTALKPAHEPIVLARKPLAGTVAGNVLAHGTGALNIDGCRTEGPKPDTVRGAGGQNGRYGPIGAQGAIPDDGRGRWPANIVLDPEAGAMLDEQAPDTGGGGFCGGGNGGASRFFYCPKTSSAERNAGLDGFDERQAGKWAGGIQARREAAGQGLARNVHPTVKPIELMRWLIRLVTPGGGRVLDPFLGSGTTGCAAALEGVDFIGIEREADYLAIAEARIEFWRGYEGTEKAADALASDAKEKPHRDAGQLTLG